jgi:hypothetical protein
MIWAGLIAQWQHVEMIRPGPLPPPLNSGPFHVAQASQVGVRRGRLRSADLDAPFYGIRTHGTPQGARDLALAFAVAMAPDEYFGHLSAAHLLGLRMPDGYSQGPLDVTSIAPMSARRRAGILGHRTEVAVTTVVVGGLRLSSPIATWCDLAATLSFVELVAMGDGLVCRKAPVATLAQLRAAVEQMVGRRGAKRLSRVMLAIRANSDSYKETELRLALADAGFPEPEVNGVIRNEYGAVIAHGDLVFRPYRVIVEYDGGQHRGDERQYNIDIARIDELVELEWRVIRVNKELLYRRTALSGKVGRALRAGGWSPVERAAR